MPSCSMYLTMSLSGLGCLALDLALMWWDQSIFEVEAMGAKEW